MVCNKGWLIEPEGIVFSATLWLSFCANLTMIFAFPNEYVQKHFILTLTCTSWIALLYLNLLKLNFFEGKIACTKSQTYVSIFGIATSVISAVILLFSDSKFDSAHEDATQNSGINWFCMMEQCVVALLYLSIIFIEKVVAYAKTLKLCMPGNKKSESVAPPQETNDNFEKADFEALNTQHIVIPIEVAEVEEVESEIEQHSEDEKVEHTPEDASYEVIPEQNNKQASAEQAIQNAEENQQHSESVSENDELLNEAPTKERHADVAPRSNDDKKADSDV
jgi:hypothetical protein